MTEHTWTRLTWLTVLLALASAALLAAIGCVLPDTLHGHSRHHGALDMARAGSPPAPAALQSRPFLSEAAAPAHVLRDRLRHLELRHRHSSG